MKKLFVILSLAVFGLALYSCNSSDGGKTPSETAEKGLKCIVNKDYKGYVDLLYFKSDTVENKNSEEVKKSKEELEGLIAGKVEADLKEKGGIKEYKVLGEEIKENDAVVKYEITYGNGETVTEEMKLIKTKDDKWKINSGK